MKITIIENQLLYIQNKEKVFLRGNKIVFDSDGEKNVVKIPLKTVLFRSKYLKRLFRLDIRCFSKLGDSYFFFLKKTLYMVDSNYMIHAIRYFENMTSPLYFCASKKTQTIYFGDYSNNLTESKVNIYSLDNQGNIKVLVSFSPGVVKHIHNIYECEDGGLLIMTGDSNEESGIWSFKNGTLKPICAGEQKYRTCFLTKRANKIIFLTDSPLSKNYICSYNIDNSKLCLLKAINGPCINALEEKDILYFSTSVEPNPLRKRVFNNFVVSEFIEDKCIHIYKYIVKTDELIDLYKIKKDFHNMKYFGLGNSKLFFHNKTLYLVPLGNQKLYGKTIVIDLEI